MKRALSILFGGITTARNWGFNQSIIPSYQSTLPVISVGNIVAGGSGKTPLTIWIVQWLKSTGKNPVVLCRGYGGKEKGPRVILADDPASLVGDEPVLIAQKAKVPVVIAHQRVAGAKYIEERQLGDCIVLDDGLQHRFLKRDLDLILIPVNATTDFIENRLLPWGMLRERREPALARASGVIFSLRGELREVPESIQQLIPSAIPTFSISYDKLNVHNPHTEEVLPPQSVHSLSGIANPEGFHAMISAQGYTLLSTHIFPDHYAFNRPTIEVIAQLSKKDPVICTEKDWVKLRDFNLKNVFVASLEVSIANDESFKTLLMSAFKK